MRFVRLSLLSIVVVACGHLETRSPASVDLSGTWQLDARSSDAALPIARPRDAEDDDEDRPNVTGRPPRFLGPSPLLPMLTATRMTISQDAMGMGIAYPNQPYRDLKWGEQKRSLYVIDAGWEQNRLIVQTKSRPVTVRETYSLSDTGETLTVAIDVRGQHGTHHVTRVFTRAPESAR